MLFKNVSGKTTHVKTETGFITLYPEDTIELPTKYIMHPALKEEHAVQQPVQEVAGEQETPVVKKKKTAKKKV